MPRSSCSRSASCRCTRAGRGRRPRPRGREGVRRAVGADVGVERRRATARSSDGWRTPAPTATCTSRSVSTSARTTDPARSTTRCWSSVPRACCSRHRKLMPTMHERVFHGVGAGDDLDVVELPGVGRVGGLICWENRMPLARWRRLPGRTADLAGADRRRQRRLDRVDAPHRHRGRRLRGQRAPVHPGRRRSRPTSRCRCPTARTCSAEAVPASCRPSGEVIAGPLYDAEGIVAADCDLARRCTPSATSTSPATTAEPTCWACRPTR